MSQRPRKTSGRDGPGDRKPARLRTWRDRLDAQKQGRRTARRWWMIGGALAVVTVAVVVFLVTSNRPGPAPGEKVPEFGREHINPVGTQVRYQQLPPSSGMHWQVTARYGVYEEFVEEELWVHNLEHGAVVVLYNCATGCPDLVRQLRDAYNTFPPSSRFREVKMVVAPYPEMDNRLAYLAWGWEYKTDGFDRSELLAFYRAHLDQGPELAQ